MHIRVVVAWLALAGWVAACGGDTPADPDDPTPRTPLATELGVPIGASVSTMIGPAGGELSSADGRLTIEIPAGALATDTVITIQPITAMAPGAVGDGYLLMPEGQTFAVPVVLRLAYSDVDLDGSGPEHLAFAVQNAERYWELQRETVLDAGTISIATSHFSRWNAAHYARLQPALSTVNVGETATFTVELCADTAFEANSWGPAFVMTKCEKASPSYAADKLSNWAVNTIPGGNATYGTIDGRIELGYFVAPDAVPNPAFVTVSVDDFSPLLGARGQLRARVRIVGGRAYIGHFLFTQESPETSFSADADLIWEPIEEAADVRRYRATGAASVADFTTPDCDPATFTLPIAQEGGGELVVYTEKNVAFPRMHQFATVFLGTVTLSCGTPRMAITTQLGVSGTVGICDGLTLAPYHDEELLTGEASCPSLFVTRSSWSFRRE